MVHEVLAKGQNDRMATIQGSGTPRFGPVPTLSLGSEDFLCAQKIKKYFLKYCNYKSEYRYILSVANLLLDRPQYRLQCRAQLVNLKHGKVIEGSPCAFWILRRDQSEPKIVIFLMESSSGILQAFWWPYFWLSSILRIG